MVRSLSQPVTLPRRQEYGVGAATDTPQIDIDSTI